MKILKFGTLMLVYCFSMISLTSNVTANDALGCEKIASNLNTGDDLDIKECFNTGADECFVQQGNSLKKDCMKSGYRIKCEFSYINHQKQPMKSTTFLKSKSDCKKMQKIHR